MVAKVLHYVSHGCGPQECDCRPRCFQREGDDIQTTSTAANVTCKNCLKGLAADKKQKSLREQAQIRSHKAWMDEARGVE
ncbi:hypothetical protein [Pseudomonas iridis]|uniref:hypothetical protein n=1 Tax=Pseudomonas iridis TaxID=2710587 RepID=UPI001B33FF29|nr:hypothetical protein [Pseudomonas iridis]MBP5968703.1 hypothetical protein [Pseudomonas iridis]